MRRLHYAWLAAVIALLVLVPALLTSGARSANNSLGLIAFARADGVYVMRADGTGIRPVWRSSSGHVWGGLAWSPDGRKLAFVRSDPGSGAGLWVMNADGSEPERLATVTAVTRPSWSPDGRKIAYTAARSDRSGDIWVMKADGSAKRPLARTPRLSEMEVNWDPAGGRITFSADGYLPSIYVINTNGSNLHKLTSERAFVWSEQPDWSPDGRRIVFTYAAPFGARQSLGPPNCDIWIMNASGNSRVQLTKNKVHDGSPAWSPNGQRIAFVRDAANGNPDSGEIYVMNADGTGVTRLTHNHVTDTSPAWQPVAAP